MQISLLMCSFIRTHIHVQIPHHPPKRMCGSLENNYD